MSLKKTWFSYVLWVLFAGLTGLITYAVTVKVFAVFPVFALVGAAAVAALCILLHFICGKIKPLVLSKWAGRVLHILLFLLIAAVFILLRLPSIMNLSVVELSEQAACFYQASMVGAWAELTSVPSLFEQAYINVLSGLFLFLGNKAEILYYFQLFLQSVSFLLLIVIGWILQKRIYAWIPALFYAVSPFLCSAVSDVGPANFWMCIVLFGVSVVCTLEKAWKNRNITYIVLTITEIVFGILLFVIKADVLVYGKAPFTSGGIVKGTIGVLSIEMLIAAFLLIFYCVSFWFDKQDHRILYLLPFTGYCVLLAWLSFYEFDSAYFCVMLAAFNLYILTTESLRVIFTFKPEIVTGQTDKSKVDEVVKPEDFEWTDMQKTMSEAVQKEEQSKTEGTVSEQAEAPIEVIDKTAPIENVLPMPKKHTPKVLDYAFEPTLDMMHYDVEIENDDYDYS